MGLGGWRIKEDIHPSLEAVFRLFHEYCKENSCQYNIVSDEPNEQAFVLQDRAHKSKLYDYLTPVLQDEGGKTRVAVKIDDNRPDGVHFRFRVAAITDGFWTPRTGRSVDDSLFVHASDARKVRAGKTMYQKNFKKRLADSLYRAVHATESQETWRGKEPQDMTRVELKDYWHKVGAKQFADAGYQNYVGFVLIPRLTQEMVERYDMSQEEAKNAATKLAEAHAAKKKNLDVHLDDLWEDQYKSPTGKHRRQQSMYRSSFSRSKTFGGLKEAQNLNIAGQMIPPQIEPSSSLGTVSAARSTSSGEKQEFGAYPERKNAVDNPTTVPTSMMDGFAAKLDERLSSFDDNERSLITNKQVPDAINQPANPISPSSSEEAIEAGSSTVNPDSQADKEAMDPTGGMNSPEMAQSQNFKPLGTDVESPYYGNHGNEPHSNVNTSGLRTFEGPTVTPLKRTAQLPSNDSTAMPESSPELFHYRLKKALGQLAPGSKPPRLSRYMTEARLARPEDAYDFMQQLVKELGLATEAKKVVLSDREYVKACDGHFRMEIEDNKLSVYRRGEKIDEIIFDIRKDNVVDEAVCRLLRLWQNAANRE